MSIERLQLQNQTAQFTFESVGLCRRFFENREREEIKEILELPPIDGRLETQAKLANLGREARVIDPRDADLSKASLMLS